MTLKLPLDALHRQDNAHMAPFAGYEMPIHYSSIVNEVKTTREATGLFDVSHMGEFFLTGKEAKKALQYFVVSDVSSLKNGKAQYSMLCNEKGKVLDDIIFYQIAEDHFLICVNASNVEKDFQHIKTILEKKSFDCVLIDDSANWGIIAVQGPTSFDVMEKSFGDLQLKEMKPFEFKEITLQGEKCYLAKTGYTGEKGVEIFYAAKGGDSRLASFLWSNLKEKGGVPCGLGARDLLRIEAHLPLYGHEISEDVTPLDCHFSFVVNFEKEDFVGKQALMNHQTQKCELKLSLEEAPARSIAREGALIFRSDDVTNDTKAVGKITSGGHSPTLGYGIAIASVDKEFKTQDSFWVEIRRARQKAVVVKGRNFLTKKKK